MSGERIQRKIDALLDEADDALSRNDWETLAQRAAAALALDPANADASAYADAAARGSAGARPSAEPPPPAPPRIQPAPAVPESFANGRYRVVRFLGEGGKKRVYLAKDVRLDRDVAFALIKTDGLDLVGRERITREAQAMGRLGAQPNIVTIFEIGEEGDTPYVVNELLAGGDVEGELERAGGPLPLARTLEIAKGVCRGLAFAHERGIVHRDLKPGNVWLTEDGTAKIGDFGLAVSLDRSRLTQHGMMVGTVSYMPPEQALGGDVTPQADLYSLGAMLYELVTGKPPFQADDPTAIISQHINTPPVAPSWNSDRCPPDLEALILRLLAKVPADRPADAKEVLAVLEAIDPEARSASHSDSSVNPLDRLARGVFVGRERELERLRAAFDEAFAGHGSVVMLVGEPGVGKTRTAQELETYARMRGGCVLWGRAHEAAGAPPYRPWVQAGDSYAQQFGLEAIGPKLEPGDQPELSRIFPQLRQQAGYVPPPDIPDPDSARFRLFEAYSNLLRAYASERPLLIVLDDLHWADKPSLLLLRHIAPELSRQRILILGNYRDTDLARTHPLSETLAALNREGGFRRIGLGGLTRSEIHSYIRDTAHVEPRRELVDRIFEETEGNPFFLSEVVNLLAQEGRLSGSLADIVIPEGVREALGRRLDMLSDEANQLFQYAAIAGRQFAYDTLAAVTGHESADLLRLIEEGLGARVIEEADQPGRYAFTHALMQETLLGELSTTRRVRMHGDVGEAVERRLGDGAIAQAPRLARHFTESATLNASHAERAVRYSSVAAEQAEAQAAWAEAARLYQSAAEYSAGDRQTGELLRNAGRCLLNDADMRGAWRAFMRAMEMQRRTGDGPGFAATTLLAAGVPAPEDRMVALLDEAIAGAGRDAPILAARLRMRRAALMPWEVTDADVDEMRELVAAANDELCWIEFDAVRARRFERATDHPGPYLQLSEDLFRRYDALGDHANAGEWLRTFAAATGDLDLILTRAQQVLAYARRWRLVRVEGYGLSQLSAMTRMRGDIARSRELAAEIREDGFRALQLIALTELDGRDPDPLALAPPVGDGGGNLWFDLITHDTRAKAAYLAGDDAVGVAEYKAIERAIERMGFVFSGGPGVSAAAVRFASDGFVEKAYQRLAVCGWGRHHPAGALDWLRGAFALRLGLPLDTAEQHFRDGVDWAREQRAVFEEGRALTGLAEVAEMRGDHALALQYLDEAGAIFAKYGAHRLLSQVLAKKEFLKA